MSTSTLTSKGQTTIPADIRAFLNINPGDQIEFVKLENGKVLLASNSIDIKTLKGSLPKPKRNVSLSAMEKAIRKRQKKDS